MGVRRRRRWRPRRLRALPRRRQTRRRHPALIPALFTGPPPTVGRCANVTGGWIACVCSPARRRRLAAARTRWSGDRRVCSLARRRGWPLRERGAPAIAAFVHWPTVDRGPLRERVGPAIAAFV